MDRTTPRHPIQVVARRTGLSTDVIRVWERRYAAVTPKRSSTQRRLYSDADVERLLLLRQVTHAGRRIGDVAKLSDQELSSLIADDRASQAGRDLQPASMPQERLARRYYAACLKAIQQFDPLALEATLSQASVDVTVPVLLNQILGPLLHELGERWQQGHLRVCQEHMATAQIRSFLGGLLSTSSTRRNGPVIIVATPVGQDHELGALMVAVTAASEGWTALHLGPNTPATEIAAAVAAAKARAVALSIMYPCDDPRLPDELRRLRRQLAAGATLIAGGAAASCYANVLKEIGAVQLSTLSDLRHALQDMRSGSPNGA
jgi:DNA-binding transcriptional MerR regulator/methylmalonyl-CoA mutase cobalamin-binding subunit